LNEVLSAKRDTTANDENGNTNKINTNFSKALLLSFFLSFFLSCDFYWPIFVGPILFWHLILSPPNKLHYKLADILYSIK